MRILVDTNVILDLLLKREEGCKEALDFFLWCKKHKNKIFISSMSFRDIEYICMKTFHDKKKANSVLADVYSLCTKVVGVSADSAISSIFEDYKDFEDQLLIQTAKEELIDVIVTNNVRDFNKSDVPVFTPKGIMQSSTFVNF